jgi:hypothetical protein
MIDSITNARTLVGPWVEWTNILFFAILRQQQRRWTISTSA